MRYMIVDVIIGFFRPGDIFLRNKVFKIGMFAFSSVSAGVRGMYLACLYKGGNARQIRQRFRNLARI